MAQFTASIKINAVENLTKVSKKITKSTDKMRLGFAKLGKSLKKVGAGFSKFAKVASVAFVAAAAGLVVMIKKTANFGDSLDKTTQKTGVLTKRLQELRLAVQLGGGSSDDADKALRFLSKSMKEAADGSVEYEEVFTRLGVAVKKTDGTFRKTDEVMLDFASVFSVMEDGAEKTSDAMSVMGRAGTNLIPFLNQGRAGFEKVAKRMKFFNTELENQEAATLNDELLILRTNLAGLAREAIKPLLPSLTEDITNLDDLLPKFHKFVKENLDLAEIYEKIKTSIAGIDFKELFDVSVDAVRLAVEDIMLLISSAADFVRFVKGESVLDDSLGEGRFATLTPFDITALPQAEDAKLHVKITTDHEGKASRVDVVEQSRDIIILPSMGLITP